MQTCWGGQYIVWSFIGIKWLVGSLDHHCNNVINCVLEKTGVVIL